MKIFYRITMKKQWINFQTYNSESNAQFELGQSYVHF